MRVRFIAAAVLIALGLAALPAGGAQAQDDPAARVAALDKQIVELHRQGRFAEAIVPATELMQLYEQVLGPTHANVAVAATNLALLYIRAGRPTEAVALYQRALQIREQTLGPNHPDVVATLNSLSDLYRSQGLDGPAEAALKRTLTIREQETGPESPEVAKALDALAQHYVARGRLDDAVPLLQRSLTIREAALGAEHVEVGAALAALAAVHIAQKRPGEAEPLLKRSLAIAEAAHGAEHADVGERLDALAAVYTALGRDGEAEPLYKRSLAIHEKVLGASHPTVGATLDNLAEVYRKLGIDAEAAPLLRRSLAIKERTLGPDSADLAREQYALAEIYAGLGAPAEAEPLYKRSLAIREKVLGAEHRDVAASLDGLGRLQREQGRLAEAEPTLKRSLAIREKLLGADHPEVAASLEALGAVYAATKRPADAERAFQRSLTIVEAAYGADHPTAARLLDRLAAVARDQNKLDAALTSSRRALAILAKQVDATRTDAGRRAARAAWARHVALLQAAGGADAAAEGFRVAQLARQASAGGAVAALAARFAAGTDDLAAAVRKREGLIKDWKLLDQVLIEAAAKPTAARNLPEEAEARRYRGDIAREIGALDAKLAREFPRYAELEQPAPVALPAAQALLTGDEALLVWLVGEDETWLWVLRRNRNAVHRLDVGRRALTDEVAGLRARLDPAAGALRPFDATRAHALYTKILAPAAPLLEGAAYVMMVPDGPLESLPFGALVTRPPRADPETPADHRAPAWFLLRHAIGVLPSVGALATQRRSGAAAPVATAAAARAGVTYVGIGEPALEGKASAAQPIRLASLFRGALADVDAIRKLAPLPETATELRAVAKALGTADQNLQLGKRASEPLLRKAGLERYRIVEFATYGLVSGELRGLAEPALVLSPPDQASIEDDGLLGASKVATLKLDADWVVLSACRTALPDGTPDAGGLPALVQAFQHAGARSVLVSHWPVAAEPSAKLIAGMVAAMKQDRTMGRAEALRQAALALLHPSSPPEFAHPRHWAAFELAGEGGADR